MPNEVDAEKLVRTQREAISNFFGADVSQPTDRLFVVVETNRQEKLFKNPKIAYLPARRLAKGMDFPGQKVKLNPWIYEMIRQKYLGEDADTLPGQWIIFDSTRRPDYNRGTQMYPDTKRFKELMGDLRASGQIEVPASYRHVPRDSRFATSACEIDGKSGVVVAEVAKILRTNPDAGEQISTPSYASFNYMGNMYPDLKLGDATTSEWFSNNFGRGRRLGGGGSGFGGLACVSDWGSFGRFVNVGFRLQIAFPSRT